MRAAHPFIRMGRTHQTGSRSDKRSGNKHLMPFGILDGDQGLNPFQFVQQFRGSVRINGKA